MPRGIRISDLELWEFPEQRWEGLVVREKSVGGSLVPDLTDILAAIAEHGRHLSWAILDLEGTVGNLGPDLSVSQFETQVADSPCGYRLGWQELTAFAGKLHDLSMGLFAASQDPTVLRRYKTMVELVDACDLVIELFDSSYWRVFARDERVLQSLVAQYHDTKLLESADDY